MLVLFQEWAAAEDHWLPAGKHKNFPMIPHAAYMVQLEY